MDGLRIGDGALGGRGLYAARDFAAGEVVVGYRLRELSLLEYAALPPGEDLFVHSYGGRRFLYPEPARFVNHADDPSCYQDFARGCDVALRPIRAGEAVTIDARLETAHELSTFLAAYAASVSGLVDAGAVRWRDGLVFRGGDAVAGDLVEAGDRALEDVEWLVGTGRWEALCSARCAGRRLTMLLKVVAGNWQVVYQHLG